MSEYYAVQRSDEFLEHYGVRGMKWGVRKAIAKDSSRILAKTYKKASKKLAKLNSRADINKQKNIAAYHERKTIRSGLAGIGASGAAFGINRLPGTSHTLTLKNGGKALHITTKGVPENIKVIGAGAGLLAGAALAGKSAYHSIKADAANLRSTSKGHAKAVAKRDAWKKEMQSAFKDTAYSSLPKVKSRLERKADKYKTRADNWRRNARFGDYYAKQVLKEHPNTKNIKGYALHDYNQMAKQGTKKAAKYDRKYRKVIKRLNRT